MNRQLLTLLAASILGAPASAATLNESIRSENSERKVSDRNNENRAPERGDTRPQRANNSRPARNNRGGEDNDGTVGFGDDMPAFMKIVAKV